MLFVLRTGAAVYQDVVQVGGTEYIQVRPQCVVDESLECGGGSRQAEGHDQRFEQANTGAEGGQVLLSFSDAEVVEGRDDVDLREEFHSLQVVQGLFCQGQRVTVFNGNIVQGTVVDTEPEPASGLRDEQDR